MPPLEILSWSRKNLSVKTIMANFLVINIILPMSSLTLKKKTYFHRDCKILLKNGRHDVFLLKARKTIV